MQRLCGGGFFMRPKKRKQSNVLASSYSAGSQRPRLSASQRAAQSRRGTRGAVAVLRRAVRWIQNFVSQSVGGRRG